MAKYKLKPIGVLEVATDRLIPNDEGNRDWQEYQRWLAEGNTPDPEFTPEEEAENLKLEEIASLATDLAKTDRSLLKLIHVMFRVGVNKGIWSAADFNDEIPGIVEHVQTLKGKLDQLETLEG